MRMNTPRNPLKIIHIGDWEDDRTVIISNCKKKDMQATEDALKNKYGRGNNDNVTRVVNRPDFNQAIGNTGATGNFVQPGAPVDDIKVTVNPIKIEMPNGRIE